MRFDWDYQIAPERVTYDEDTAYYVLRNAGTGEALEEGKDYSCTRTWIKNETGITFSFTGMGAYSGTMKKTYRFKTLDIRQACESSTPGGMRIHVIVNNGVGVDYSKSGVKPAVRLNNNYSYTYQLEEGRDYTVSYSNNKKAGTGYVIVKGKKYLKGSVKVPFIIREKNLSDAAISIEAADRRSSKKAGDYSTTVRLYDDGKLLKKGRDYTDVLYTDAGGVTLDSKSKLNAGDVVYVKVEGMGNYTGSLKTSFRVNETQIGSLKVSVAAQTYAGTEVQLSGADLSFKEKGKVVDLQCGRDYVILSYKNNNKAGTATAVLKGIGNYAGYKTVKFKIGKRSLQWQGL